MTHEPDCMCHLCLPGTVRTPVRTIRQTHTFAVLELSAAAFKEIRDKLEAAGYQHAFIKEDEELTIDMHGIGIKEEKKE